MSFTTMILRFRDLSTNPGETIRFHREKIEQHGFAWWGWWSKAGETIPSDAFRTVMSKMKKTAPLEVYLFDTGSNQLFAASLEEIHWNNLFNEESTPDPDATPKYYGARRLKAWYRFSEIRDLGRDETWLRQWTYVGIPELFETKRSVFEDFYGKQVSSLDELRYQERTIWFVRPYADGDETREIHVYDTARTRPSNFPERVIECHSTNLLWLSDIHFSTEQHAFPLKEGPQTGNRLSEAIRRDLESHFQLDKVGGILLSGDLTWKADPDEFALARTFLNDIMSWSTLRPSQVALCPGNHDLAFSNEPWKKGVPVTKTPSESRRAFEDFYADLFSVPADEFLACGRRFVLDRVFTVDVACLNSSYLRQTDDVFQGHGYVGELQRQSVEEQMGWREEDEARPLRFLMMHHHLVPVIPQDVAAYGENPSVVYDAGALCNWVVKHRIDVVLHGHMHHTKVVREQRPGTKGRGWHGCTIASLGSAGVKLEHNELDRKNVYALLQFTNEGLALTVRQISSRDEDRPDDGTVFKHTVPWKRAYALQRVDL